jgi:GntR family transcriptional regulator
MFLNRNQPVPLYEQLRLILQDKILMGELPVGTILPTEQQLCEQYQISRITARKALEDLANMGLINRVQGKGSIVTDQKLSHSPMKIRGHKRSMEEQGFRGGGKLLLKQIVPGNPNLNKLFELPENSDRPYWHFRRLRYLNDAPAVIMNSYVRKEIGDQMLKYDLDNCSFYTIFEEITHRWVIDNRALISATLASPEVAVLLNTQVGAPLVWFRGVSYVEGDIPIEVNYALFLGSKFMFETKMYRTKVENVKSEFENNQILDILMEKGGG